MLLVRYPLQSIIRRRASALAPAIGIAALVFILAGTLMLVTSVRKTIEGKGNPNVAVVVSSGAGSEVDSNLLESTSRTIVAERGIDDATRWVAETVTLFDVAQSGGEPITTVLRGIPPGAERFRPAFRIVEGRMAAPNTNEIVVGVRAVSRFGRGLVGRDIEFRKNRPARVVGIFTDADSFYESEVWGDRALLQGTFGREGFVSVVRIRLDRPEDILRLRAAIESDKRFGARVFAEPDFLKRQGVVATTMVVGFGWSMSILIGLAASVGVAMTMFGAIARRRGEIGVLRAIGFGPGTIVTAILIECLAFSIAGAAVGSACALALAAVEFTLGGGSGEEVTFKLHVSGGPFGVAWVVGTFIALAGGCIPAWRASRIPPTAALRGM